MFKPGSFEDEIFHSMENKLVANKVEKRYGFDKLAKAADLLSVAASIFEQAGMQEEAVEVTNVLQELAQQFSGKDRK